MVIWHSRNHSADHTCQLRNALGGKQIGLMSKQFRIMIMDKLSPLKKGLLRGTATEDFV